MANAITGMTFEAGYIVLTDERGNRTRYPIADVLRALDIPTGLTYIQVGAIKTLANMMADLTKKLIDLEVLPAEFTGENGYDLDAIIQTIEDMGGDYAEPDLTVS